jgi:hypothetical protein
LLCAGCAHHPPRSAPFASDAGRTAATAIDADAEQAHAAAVAFLTEEARGNAAADTLLASGADFIMTGVKVSTKPRLAGLNGPGQAVVEEANLGVAGAFAWVVMTYRFTGRVPELSERARATVILEKQRAGWRIRHVHSSMVARW